MGVQGERLKVLTNRKKNYLYTHEDKPFLLAVSMIADQQYAHPCIRVPMITADNLKGVVVSVYKPTKKLYTDKRMFPGKEMPQREYRYDGHSYSAVK